MRRTDDFAGELVHSLLYLVVLFASRGAGKPGMDGMHPSVAIEEDGRRKSAKVHQLGQRLLDLSLVGGAGQQQREGQAVLGAIDADLPQIARSLVGVLVSQA